MQKRAYLANWQQVVSTISLKLELHKLTPQPTPRLKSSVQVLYTLGMFLLVFLVCAIAQSLFSGPYSILYNTISDQGFDQLNPAGYKVFNLGIFITGFIQIPILVYFFKNISPKMPIVAIISFPLTLLGAVGVSFVGVFPMNNQRLHWIAAGFAFFGMYFGANIQFISFLAQRNRITLEKFFRAALVLVLVLINLTFINMIIGMGIRKDVITIQPTFKQLFSFALWEWCYLFSILAYILLQSVFWHYTKVTHR
jgi:hypothetical membrane protein